MGQIEAYLEKILEELRSQGTSVIIDCSTLPTQFNIWFNLTEADIITVDEFMELWDTPCTVKMRVSDGNNAKDVVCEKAYGRYVLTALTEISMEPSGIAVVGIFVGIDDEGTAVMARTSVGFAPNPYSTT